MSTHDKSGDTYRTPGRTVDETEIVRAKIHEAAETKRKAIAERELTKREAIKNRDTVGYLLSRGVFSIAFVLVTLIGYYAAESYFQTKKPAELCKELVRSRGSFNGVDCPRADQTLVSTEKEWICACPRPVKP